MIPGELVKSPLCRSLTPSTICRPSRSHMKVNVMSFRRVTAYLALIAALAVSAAAQTTPPPAPSSSGLDEAKRLVDSGKYTEAIAVLEGIASSDQASAPQALWLTGQCYKWLHDWEKAIESYHSLLSRYPNSALPNREVKAEIMACYLQNNEVDKCLALRNELLSDYQSDAWRLYRIVGRGYVYRHEHAKAVPELKKAIELASCSKNDPDLVEANKWLLHSYVELKQWTEAENLGEKLVKDHPDEAYQWHYELGRCYRGQKEYDKAIGSLETAAKLAPKDALILTDAYKMLLDCYNSTAQWDTAVTHAKKLADEYPEEPRWKMELGRFYIEKHEYDNAVPLFQEAMPRLKAAWEIRKCHIYLGECLYRLGKGRKALKEIEDYYKDKPELWDEKLIAKSAVLLYGGKDYAASAAVAKELLAQAAGGKKTAHVFTAHEILNKAFEGLGEWTQAARSLEALTSESGEVGYLSRAGQYYFRARNYAEAKRVYKGVMDRANVADDVRAACMYGLALCYQETGLKYAAKRLMQRVCEEYPRTEGGAKALIFLYASSYSE
jgi:tetratricopeptide (TPR) repeat protein